MAENYKHLYEQMKMMVEKYQDEIVPGLRKVIADNEARRMVSLDDVYRLIAGHSVYHGDNILAALTCVAEGKEVKPVKPLETLRPTGRWILSAHKEKWILSEHKEEVSCRWNVTVECSECCDEVKEIWAGFFPGVPDSMAREIALMDAKQVKLSNYCPNCGAKMEG